jgi:pre-mRNA-splicing factor SYF1
VERFMLTLKSTLEILKLRKWRIKKWLKSKLLHHIFYLTMHRCLKKNNFFEESFKVYETGITLFVWPGVYDVWLQYIAKFVSRYQNQKIERTRDLFEKVLVIVPVEVKYSKF